MHTSESAAVYPKYTLIDPKVLIWSGFKEQRVHLYIGFGIFGAIRHGIIGMNIEDISVVVEIIKEYIIFFLNCIF